MIVSLLRFDLKPDSVDDLRLAFRRHEVLETAIQVEGCHNLVLAAPDLDGTTAFVVGLWDDEAAYQRWMNHPERGKATDDLLQLVAGEFNPSAPAELWEVLHAISDSEQEPP